MLSGCMKTERDCGSNGRSFSTKRGEEQEANDVGWRWHIQDLGLHYKDCGTNKNNFEAFGGPWAQRPLCGSSWVPDYLYCHQMITKPIPGATKGLREKSNFRKFFSLHAGLKRLTGQGPYGRADKGSPDFRPGTPTMGYGVHTQEKISLTECLTLHQAPCWAQDLQCIEGAPWWIAWVGAGGSSERVVYVSCAVCQCGLILRTPTHPTTSMATAPMISPDR